MIAFLPSYVLHPLSNHGTGFWGGIGSDFSELTLLGGFGVWLRMHNCHVRRCPRLQWHPHPDHGHPVCRHHHPESGSVSA